jgi:hypothetical protein
MGQETFICTRCGELNERPGTGVPRFSDSARVAPEALGGLLTLHKVKGSRVSYVGRCPGGAIGITESGDLAWVSDMGYLGRIEVDGVALRLDGRLVTVDTGFPV